MLLRNGMIFKIFILMDLAILKDLFSPPLPPPPVKKGLFEKQNYEEVCQGGSGGEG